MTHHDLSFKITHKIKVKVDLHRKCVVISCKTKDGSLLHLETTYKALDRIQQELQLQLIQLN